VAHNLQAALSCVGEAGYSRLAVLLAADLGDDADAAAAIALHGANGIPPELRAWVTLCERIENAVRSLFGPSLWHKPC
jgi:ADP-ribosylglycohydrolase